MSEMLGKRLKLARTAKGLNQDELAEKVGLRSSSYISMLERGERQPSMRVLRQLAEVLGVTPEYLLDGHREMEPQAPPRPRPRLVRVGEPHGVYSTHPSARQRLEHRMLRAQHELEALLPWYARAPRELREVVKILLVGYFEASPPPLEVLEEEVLRLLQYDPQSAPTAQALDPTLPEPDAQTLQAIEAYLEREETELNRLREHLLNQ